MKTGFQGNEQTIVDHALTIVRSKMLGENRAPFTSSNEFKDYFTLKLAHKKSEVFAGVLLDSQHRFIEYMEFFFGTVDGCTIHIREVLRACIEYNAAAIVLVHNHPSGETTPSQADIHITKEISEVLKKIDVRVLDHFIVGTQVTSMAQTRGMP